MNAPDDRMMQFTCLNCQVLFKTRDLQRDHYKTDWHRYNLKRKIADLPPVSAEEFQQRVHCVQQENANQTKGKTYTYCSVCKKSFASKQSFENHLQSKRHTDLVRKKIDSCDVIAQASVKNNRNELVALPHADSDDESIETASSGTEEIDSDEWEDVVSENNPILSNDCLFCSHHSASLTKNIKHMSVSHSFFIPFIEYVTDVKGLLVYLGEKICQGYMCIWCSEKINCFSSLSAVRSHMIDKGHTKIPYDTEASLEYADFYDFDVEFENDESINGGSSSVDGSFGTKAVASDEDDATMVLPSGDIICHRSLVKYIRQNPIIVQKKALAKRNKRIDKLIQHYRHLGWNPTQKEMVKKRARDMKFINHFCSAYQTKLGVKANKLQHHFRVQVNF